MIDDLATLDATELAEWVRAKRVSPLEVIDAAIARIERLNPQLNAVIHPAFAEARARALRDDLTAAPFRGVPILFKDTSAHTSGQPMHCGNRLLKNAGFVYSGETSYLVQRLLAAGMISLGRTNVPEFGLLTTTEPEAYGPTCNPWDVTCSPGGSSGGAAAAVAAGLVPVAHASDGGGSIRGPAGHCGLVGLKPTRGRCSLGPAVGEAWNGLVSDFALTRSVRDAAAMLDLMAGPMPGDPYSPPLPARPYALIAREKPAPQRVGVLRSTLRDVPLDPECLAAVDRAARVLEELGHHVEEAHPQVLEEPQSNMLLMGIVVANLARTLSLWGERLGKAVTAEDVEASTWALAEFGWKMPAVQLLSVLELSQAFTRRLASWFSDFDLLLTPTAAAPPPKLGYLTSTRDEPLRGPLRSSPYSVFTYAWNLSGQPAISLPAGLSKSGLPLGVQLVAASAGEDLLLQMAAQFEAAAPWPTLAPLATAG